MCSVETLHCFRVSASIVNEEMALAFHLIHVGISYIVLDTLLMNATSWENGHHFPI